MVENDSGMATVQVDTGDLVVLVCAVTFFHGAAWRIPNIFDKGHIIYGDDDLANVTHEVFTMYLMRSVPTGNNEFNITSLLWFYAKKAENIFIENSNEITVICSNPDGSENDSITVRLGR